MVYQQVEMQFDENGEVFRDEREYKWLGIHHKKPMSEGGTHDRSKRAKRIPILCRIAQRCPAVLFAKWKTGLQIEVILM